jgi:D-glycero-alpha-D-manno-heptose-7-phosphate kinase
MKIAASAPLRLPLGGGGTDLPWYASRRGRGGLLVAAAIRNRVRVTLDTGDGRGRAAVDSRWLREALRLLGAPCGISVRLESDVPPGSGLGGSGAVLVALGHALARLRGRSCTARHLAEQAYRVEHDLMGRPVGRQDPYVAAYGGVIRLRIARDGATSVQRLRLASETLGALEGSLLLADTGERRSAAKSLGAQRRAASRGVGVLRTLDAIRTIGRRIARHLEEGRTTSLGDAFRQHWELKRTLCAGTSTAAAERCLRLALEAGALGGKLVGAGGGGFVLLDCGPQRLRVRRALAASGFEARRVRLGVHGSRVWLPRACTGRAA